MPVWLLVPVDEAVRVWLLVLVDEAVLELVADAVDEGDDDMEEDGVSGGVKVAVGDALQQLHAGPALKGRQQPHDVS